MKRTVVILLLSGSLLAVGCSRPTAEAPAPATPAPQKSPDEQQKEQMVKASTVEKHEMKAEPMNDRPTQAVSPSPSANPKP